MRAVATYLNVSHQRVAQMRAEGKLPEPERVDGIGPLWKPATIERWAELMSDHVEVLAVHSRPCRA